METAGFIEVLRREGGLLADAADEAGLDAPVPPCPGWRVRDLVRHTGAVHRWATGFVAEQRKEPGAFDDSAPGDAELTRWYRERLEDLAGALAAAPQDLDCWYFLRAPSALAFWSRRQAHEVAVHRADAQAALGGPISPVDADFASDGVDELLSGFHGRSRSKLRTPRPGTLRVRATDTGGDWLVRLSPQPPVIEPGGGRRADCTVSGTAAELYVALWNRTPGESLSVEGDAGLLEAFRRTGAIN